MHGQVKPHVSLESSIEPWCSGVLYFNKALTRFCAGSNPSRGVSETRNGEDI